jgi:hypothetical protein
MEIINCCLRIRATLEPYGHYQEVHEETLYSSLVSARLRANKGIRPFSFSSGWGVRLGSVSKWALFRMKNINQIINNTAVLPVSFEISI